MLDKDIRKNYWKLLPL